MAIAPGMDRSKAPMLRLMSEERRNRELFEKIIRANSGTVNAGGRSGQSLGMRANIRDVNRIRFPKTPTGFLPTSSVSL